MRYLILLLGLLLAAPSFAGQGIIPSAIYYASGGGSGISDSFSTDTSANYSALTGTSDGITVSSGAAHGPSWGSAIVRHTTSVTSANQTVSATLGYTTGSDGGGVIARCDGTTGYAAFIEGGIVYLQNITTGGALNYITGAEYDGAYTTGNHTISLTTNGTTISVSVDGTERISITNSTVTAGNYAGIYIKRGAANADITIDNFAANTP